MTRLRWCVRIQFDELLRLPAFSVPSILLPVLSYLIFGLPSVHGNRDAANAILVAFAAFAVLGIVMFQFGVGLAADRVSPWERYLRTLPTPARVRFTARLIVALGFSAVSLVPLAILAAAVSPVDLGWAAAGRVIVALVAGAVPLGLLGMMLGYLLSERGAVPVTNVVFLPLSYAGGLFGTPIGELPRFARSLSPWLPTRQWSDLLLDFGVRGHLPAHPTIALAAYGVGFAALAGLGYRRDEQRQYR